MALRHEAEVQAEIAEKFGAELTAMTALQEAVLGIMLNDTLTLTGGHKRFVTETVLILLTKAIKTFRAIQLLCERGLHDDANALLRVLMETAALVHFIFEEGGDSFERTKVFHAYSVYQALKMIRLQQEIPEMASDELAKAHEDGSAKLADLVAQIAPDANYKDHWSGKRSLEVVMKDMGWESIYATVFRMTSATLHSSDTGSHFSMTDDTEEVVFEIDPRVKGFDIPSQMARYFLSHMARTINDGLGLGFEEQLRAHEVTGAVGTATARLTTHARDNLSTGEPLRASAVTSSTATATLSGATGSSAQKTLFEP